MRDFVSVHDVVDMVMLMLENDEAIGKAFDCCILKTLS
jgi:UDP-glucose 4-epimerase